MKYLKILCSGVLLGSGISMASIVHAETGKATGPRVSLFTSDIQADLGYAQQSAQKMEEGVKPHIDSLQRQKTLYEASQCNEPNQDQGCKQIQQQMSASYRAMLKSLQGNLPEMQSSVERTYQGLGKRLVNQVGGMSGSDLQKLIIRDKGKPVVSRSKAKRPGRLSQQLSAYVGMLSSSVLSSSNMLNTGSELYLDMAISRDQLAQLNDLISVSLLQLDMSQAMPGVSTETMANLDAIKGIVFGESEIANATGVEWSDDSAELQSSLNPYENWN